MQKREKMSKKASNFQIKFMSIMYRGKEIFKPLNTGWIDEHVACVREYIANIFFYRKNGKTSGQLEFDWMPESITFNGVSASLKENSTLTWTATTITWNGTTIDA